MTTIKVELIRNGLTFIHETELDRFGPKDLEGLSIHIMERLRNMLNESGETGWEAPDCKVYGHKFSWATKKGIEVQYSKCAVCSIPNPNYVAEEAVVA